MRSLKINLAILVTGVAALFAPVVVACPQRFATNQLGDGQMYSCYLSGEDENYCYYDCYSLPQS
jgi:hypothetical protein